MSKYELFIKDLEKKLTGEAKEKWDKMSHINRALFIILMYNRFINDAERALEEYE